MRFSSIISLLILCLVLNFFMGCSHFRKSSNDQKSRPIKFREIKLIITFSWISDDEKPKIEDFFKDLKGFRMLNSSELAGNERFGFEINIDSKNLRTIEDLNQRVINWNKAILSIGKDKKAQILGEDKITIKLGYISTQATTRTSAKLIILPEPNGAKLFIDTNNSDLDLPKDPFDDSIILNVEGRLFETFLPFSFIMENPRIYFRTRLNNITRYFYYDLKLEKQIEIFGITSENDYKYYQKHGELPSRD
jgi:hypothetical protein